MLWVSLLVEPGELDGAVLVWSWGTPVASVRSSWGLFRLVPHVLGCEESTISVPPWPLAAVWKLGEVNASLWLKHRCQGKGSLTIDMGKVITEAAGVKSKCVHQDLLGLNYL